MASIRLGLCLWLYSAAALAGPPPRVVSGMADPGTLVAFDHYHSQEEINSYLRGVAHRYPGLVHLRFLGYSQQGREINYVVLSNRQSNDLDGMPSIFLNGTHHGDEKASTESILAVIDFLTRNRQTTDVGELLDNYAIYLQPVVNADGHALASRFDVQGRDPNRDYAFPERSDEESFKIPDVRLIKQLADKVHFRAALAFHSGMEGVLWAWAYSNQRASDNDTFYTLAKATAQAMGMNRYSQSYGDYPSRGEFIDYVYWAHGTLAMTVEVASDPTPTPGLLPLVVKRAVAGTMAFMLSLFELDHGSLKVEHPTEPLLAPLAPPGLSFADRPSKSRVATLANRPAGADQSGNPPSAQGE